MHLDIGPDPSPARQRKSLRPINGRPQSATHRLSIDHEHPYIEALALFAPIAEPNSSSTCDLGLNAMPAACLCHEPKWRLLAGSGFGLDEKSAEQDPRRR